MPTPTIPTFATPEEANAWMIAELEKAGDDECVDNDRFAYVDDVDSMAAYDAQRDTGCCGEFDQEVVVAGRRARVGCNFGH